MTDPRAAAVEAAYLALMKCDLQGGYGSLPTKEDAADLLSRMAEAGWVMVPREATQEMLPQAWRTIRHHGGQGVDHDCLRAVWSAMIRAAMLGRDDPPRADGEG